MMVRIIVNPVAGKGKSLSSANRLADYLRAQGAEVDLEYTRQKGDAERFAAKPRADCVVSVGGDGTANEVANGVALSNAPMAILPVGTANAVAREIRSPVDPVLLGNLILNRSVKRIDAGKIQGRRFLLCAGAGPDAAVVHRVHAHRGNRMGLAAYFLPTLPTLLRYPYPRFQVTMDDGSVIEHVEYAVAANCRFSAGVFPVASEARIDDGLLDVVLFRDLSLVRMAYYAAMSYWKSMAKQKGVLYCKARKVRFDAPKETVHFQVDGDPAGFLPVVLEIESSGVEIIAS